MKVQNNPLKLGEGPLPKTTPGTSPEVFGHTQVESEPPLDNKAVPSRASRPPGVTKSNTNRLPNSNIERRS
jgi:hypothetical protein